LKIETKSKEGRLEFFKSLYERAKNNAQDLYSSFDRQLKQYRGSDEIDGGERALTVRNITFELIESQISSEIPMPKTDPVSHSDRHVRCAEAIERLCRSLRSKLPFDELNDIDERYTYVYGGSVWYADWDNGISEDGKPGGIKLLCLSPKDFIPQPGIFSIEDMEYCFLKFTTTRAEIQKSYGVCDEDLSFAECEYEYGGEGDALSVTVCFYKDEDGEVGRFIFSGGVTLSDVPRYYMRKIRVCRDCENEEALCICGSKRRTLRDVTHEEAYLSLPAIGADAPTVESLKITYYVPKSFPLVIRKNISTERQLFGQSDCDYIRPQQQAINKVESRILQKLLRSAVTPIVPEDATVSLNNAVFGQVIKMKPGESAAQYGKVDTTPNVSQDIAEAERLYDQAKRIMGISDAFVGVDSGSYAESGVAKRLRINQASGRLESKRKMKDNAYSRLDKILFSLYLAFADEPRKLSYKDAYGNVHTEEFNRYDFIEYDSVRGEYFYDDGYMFSVDLNDGAAYERESLWERNLENLKSGTLGPQDSPITLLRYWQCQERAHYPHARENVEYFKNAVEEERRGNTNV
jgi:hypothetical protein